ncbi:iron complex transport system substrate-binding protein [Natranaerovirga hydrolytica]|uniref:Iron complex transport system substrate-binding protein n=1 Tax=Natranaerovirga hydrolytica TaxID=680378 RepID=A0A4R1MSB5_9FIRM|nr:ABC transporter substrate-binding protein [Natranaerovirga hydrolytica]TCK92813.1 iron complex transport system substrate-binding protein [Natranaerovirga hydrolytica]
MKKLMLILVCVMSFSAILVGCGDNKEESEAISDNIGGQEEHSPSDQEDDEDTEDQESIRVIAGTVASAEFLDLLDITPVGVATTDKELPSRYDDVPRIGTPMDPNLEQIVSLAPDIYISDNNLKESIDSLLEGHQIQTLFLTNNAYEDVMNNFTELGDFFNQTEIASELVTQMENVESETLEAVEGQDAPRVLVVFGTPESFMLATDRSYAGSLVKKLGGINVTDEIEIANPGPYVPFSEETVAELNPDVILRLSHAAPEATKAAFDREFASGFWVNLDAVQEGNVYDLDSEIFGVTANVKAKEALQLMAEMLYQ